MSAPETLEAKNTACQNCCSTKPQVSAENLLCSSFVTISMKCFFFVETVHSGYRSTSWFKDQQCFQVSLENTAYIYSDLGFGPSRGRDTWQEEKARVEKVSQDHSFLQLPCCSVYCMYSSVKNASETPRLWNFKLIEYSGKLSL